MLPDENDAVRWVAWKRAVDAVGRAVEADIRSATGLSSADFSVLTRLVEEGGGSLRQQRLSDQLDWERSRLSRHLIRMQDRGLVQRTGTTTERLITATTTGHQLAVRARAAHADSVRQHLLDVVPAGRRDAFWEVIHDLGTR